MMVDIRAPDGVSSGCASTPEAEGQTSRSTLAKVKIRSKGKVNEKKNVF